MQATRMSPGIRQLAIQQAAPIVRQAAIYAVREHLAQLRLDYGRSMERRLGIIQAARELNQAEPLPTPADAKLRVEYAKEARDLALEQRASGKSVSFSDAYRAVCAKHGRDGGKLQRLAYASGLLMRPDRPSLSAKIRGRQVGY